MECNERYFVVAGDLKFEVYCVSLVLFGGILFCFIYVESCKDWKVFLVAAV